jgi:hypothetical protein
MAHEEAEIVNGTCPLKSKTTYSLIEITGMSESPSKWLDSNTPIYSHCETWNAVVT